MTMIKEPEILQYDGYYGRVCQASVDSDFLITCILQAPTMLKVLYDIMITVIHHYF